MAKYLGSFPLDHEALEQLLLQEANEQLKQVLLHKCFLPPLSF